MLWLPRRVRSDEAASSAVPTALLEKSPQSRILVAAGYFDTMTTTGASAYLVSQEPWPADRVALKYYRGGHMAYSVEESARAFAADLRELIGSSH